MAKREIPLFIIDNTRAHKKGECDFLVCTDTESGFVARLDYVSGEVEEVGDMYRIGYARQGVSRRITILRLFGQNPNKANIKTLLKKGFEYYSKENTSYINADKPSKEDCVRFLDTLGKISRQTVDEAGSDYNERALALRQAKMIEATINYLEDGRE